MALPACQKDAEITSYDAVDDTWVLEQVDGNAFAASATITFPEPGRVAGQAPCNLYNADITSAYPVFTLGPILSTKRACPDMAAEAQFYEALALMTRTDVADGTLTLSSDTGGQMVFRLADG